MSVAADHVDERRTWDKINSTITRVRAEREVDEEFGSPVRPTPAPGEYVGLDVSEDREPGGTTPSTPFFTRFGQALGLDSVGPSL